MSLIQGVYTNVETLDDFKYQVDNFAIAKNKTTTKAMAGAMNLIKKLSPLHS
jgi:hypothetical protein